VFIINFIRGFCMALADSVPGVSGGTIAFILGFYDKFINSLNSLVSTKSNKEEKLESLKFLIKIGIGWAVGMVLAVLFISSVFTTHIYKISSLFLGFIIFSLPLIFREEKSEIVGKYKNIIFAVIGILVVAAITYFNPATSGGTGTNLSLDNLNIGLIAYVFVVGAIAICAMILPGISGSTLLLIFGIYAPIMTAVKSVIKFDFSYLPIVIVFGLGVITGIVSIIRLLRYLLANHRSKVIYTIIGLMIGSLYAVVMGPTTLEIPEAPMGFGEFSILFFLLGGALILGLEKLKKVLDKGQE
jgi:putative membrane protein